METKEDGTINLSLGEFEHLSSNKPGTCNCKLCKWYWEKVNNWIEKKIK